MKDNLYQVLGDALTKGIDFGIESLTEYETRLYYVEDFIIENEMNGLSGYLYNRIPQLDTIRKSISSMRSFSLHELADYLQEAHDLFKDYDENNIFETWREVKEFYDPNNRIDEIEKNIYRLDNYGLDDSTILSENY